MGPVAGATEVGQAVGQASACRSASDRLKPVLREKGRYDSDRLKPVLHGKGRWESDRLKPVLLFGTLLESWGRANDY